MSAVKLSEVVDGEEWAGADPNSGGARHPKIELDGTHLVRIENTSVQESQRVSAVYFVAEFTVLHTTSEPAVGVGDMYGWVHNISQKFYGVSRLKQFAFVMAGRDPRTEDANISLSQIDTANEKQLFRGKYARLTTRRIETDNNYPFTVHDWLPVSAEDLEICKKMEAAIASGTYRRPQAQPSPAERAAKGGGADTFQPEPQKSNERGSAFDLVTALASEGQTGAGQTDEDIPF